MMKWVKKLNGRKFMDSLAFPLLLATFAHSTVGVDAKMEWGLVALTGLMALVVLFENITQVKWWMSLVEWVREFDFNYIVFGLGLAAGGSAITSNPWVIIIFLLLGIGFVAVGLAQMNVHRMVKIVKSNPKSAIKFGVFVFAVGVVLTIVRWNEIVNNFHVVVAAQSILVLGIGVDYVIAGLVQGRRNEKK